MVQHQPRHNFLTAHVIDEALKILGPKSMRLCDIREVRALGLR